ncbi:hypothetical protein NMS_1287 [Nonlabens marinus S1-08]|uniref:Uncharacterized protein n=1 Tax=Nonlabens marinus S1-08 TaxID=1454201 RepID=W8VZW7_9FLAO|nr:hypothetical protein NMS_1287 [Nonlabens marinus S1-08]
MIIVYAFAKANCIIVYIDCNEIRDTTVFIFWDGLFCSKGRL